MMNRLVVRNSAAEQAGFGQPYFDLTRFNQVLPRCTAFDCLMYPYGKILKTLPILGRLETSNAFGEKAIVHCTPVKCIYSRGTIERVSERHSNRDQQWLLFLSAPRIGSDLLWVLEAQVLDLYAIVAPRSSPGANFGFIPHFECQKSS